MMPPSHHSDRCLSSSSPSATRRIHWPTRCAPQADVALAADEEAALADLVERIAATPIASTSMAVLLRASTRLDVDEALGAESAVYSALQAGAEFVGWRESRPRRDQPEDPSPAVRVEWRRRAICT